MKKYVSLFVYFCFFYCTLSLSNSCAKEPYETLRHRMVNKQIIARGITDSKVIKAMQRIERHLFVPEELAQMAYADRPLPIGYRQTISQPYIVAFMTDVLKLKGDEGTLIIH